MKSFISSIVLLLFLGSCVTLNHSNYNDPNYLKSDEFSTYAEINTNQQQEIIPNNTDTTGKEGIDYSADNYYDYSFSSRIRRFHRPLYYSSYYGGIYTDYYWYNNDPFSCGTSIYLGYNWHSPYYSYYTYSPYYFNYHSPYYYGNYYSHYNLGHNHHHYGLYNNHYTNNNHNAYVRGHRTSLSSNSGTRSLNIKLENLNIRKKISLKDKISNKRKNNLDYERKTNNSVPNRTELNHENKQKKSNNYKRNNTLKNSNRSNNYKNQNTRPNSSIKSNRGTGKRGVKPRR